MSWGLDDILANELRRLGGRGAGWMSRLLPRNTGNVTMLVHVSDATCRDYVRQLLEAIGTIVNVDEPDCVGAQCAVVGSGFGGLNPAIAIIRTDPSGPGATRIHVRAVAKEGIVKQRGGEHTARRIATALREWRPDATVAV